MLDSSDRPPSASLASAPTLGVALLLLGVAIAAASWMKGDLPRNDFERFDNLRLLSLFFALFAGLCGVYVAVYRQRPVANWSTLWSVTVLAMLLLLCSFPVGSKDIFGYAFCGKIWHQYHANPYIATAADFPNDAWQPFVQTRWRSLPTAYGPLFLWQAWMVDVLAWGHGWLAVWLHKVCAALAFVALLGVARAILAPRATNAAVPTSLLLLAWNPLFLFETAGNAHNDIVMALLLRVALWSWQRDAHALACSVLALAFWYKWYSVLFGVVFLVDAFKRGGSGAVARDAAAAALAGGVAGIVLLATLPAGSLPAIVHTVLHPAAMRGIYPTELSPPLAVLYWGLSVIGWSETDVGMRAFDLARFGLFGIAIAAVIVHQWRRPRSFTLLVESCFGVAVAFFLLLITMLLPWHLLVVVALGLVSGEERLILAAVAFTVLALLSYFVTFAIATLMGGLAVGAVWLLRRYGSAKHPVGAVNRGRPDRERL